MFESMKTKRAIAQGKRKERSSVFRLREYGSSFTILTGTCDYLNNA